MTDTIYAATDWPTNAAMIADVAWLGYLQRTDTILDPTWGSGGWWRAWRPLDGIIWGLDLTHVRSVLNGEKDTAKLHSGWDFRAMFFGDESFDAVAFDPPYVSVGGRDTSGIKDMHAAYGMNEAPKSPQGVQDDINAGLAECYRVVKRGGIVLVKCQDYVTSGKLWLGTHHTLAYALGLGFEVVDRLEHISGPRPQPPGRRQVHAHRNLSTLFVLRRPKRGK